MRRPIRALAATAAAATIALTGAATAGALERSPEPPEYYPDFQTIVSGPQIISPYGNTAHCWTYKEVSYYGCYQQVPNGDWVKLQQIPQIGAVYPIWEDPEAFAASLPPQLVELINTVAPTLLPTT